GELGQRSAGRRCGDIGTGGLGAEGGLAGLRSVGGRKTCFGPVQILFGFQVFRCSGVQVFGVRGFGVQVFGVRVFGVRVLAGGDGIRCGGRRRSVRVEMRAGDVLELGGRRGRRVFGRRADGGEQEVPV